MLIRRDPSGLVAMTEEPPWYGNPGAYDVDSCLRFLQGVVVALPLVPGQGGQHFKCARSLLKRFLDGGQQGATCTAECEDALKKYDWTARFNDFASDFLNRNHDCGFKGRIDLSDLIYDFREGRDSFEKDDDRDLYFAFHEFTLVTLEAACDVNCAGPTGCCCDCSGKCGGIFKVTDDYDFCSSLGPNPGALARCGCIIETHRKQHGQPSGSFKLDCSVGHKTDLRLKTRICYPKDNPGRPRGPRPRQ